MYCLFSPEPHLPRACRGEHGLSLAGGCEDDVEHAFVKVMPAGCEPILAECDAFRSSDFKKQKFPARFRDEEAWSGDAFFAGHPLHKHIGLLALALPCCGVTADDADRQQFLEAPAEVKPEPVPSSVPREDFWTFVTTKW